MPRIIWACALSALAGALFATAIGQRVLEPSLSAQQTRPQPDAAQLRGIEPRSSGTAALRGDGWVAPQTARLQNEIESAPAPDAAPATHALAAVDAMEPGELTAEELVNIGVYEEANRSAVHIMTRSVRPEGFFWVDVPTEGSGSGSVLDKQGHVLTNAHVIEGAQQIRVTLFNNEVYTAALVGEDLANDIAVLRIDAPPEALYPVELGDSNRLRVGQKVYAIGNPFGMERTLTTGIVSSLNRSIPSRRQRMMKSIIQIDAALNRGNSGGPLLSSRGRLIGMNTAIASMTGENTGVGFAIPVNTIRRVVPELIEHGRVIRADLGIARVYESEQGLVLAYLTPGGPADRANLRGGLVRKQEQRGPFIYERTVFDPSSADILLAIDGQPVNTADELLEILDSKRPGETVTLTIQRGQRQMEAQVALGAEE